MGTCGIQFGGVRVGVGILTAPPCPPPERETLVLASVNAGVTAPRTLSGEIYFSFI
ncbi:hypothetical protein T484DRAFT_1974827 [Baffinella frigidus]|nr:hypothetical protein T484DRAFT_1974827 [Cryptophyta sp. CCMP2293]